MHMHTKDGQALLLTTTAESYYYINPGPRQLQGVSEASERPGFFKRIMDANAAGISKAYAATEALFGQLQVWCQLHGLAPHTAPDIIATDVTEASSLVMSLLVCTSSCCVTVETGLSVQHVGYVLLL